MSNCNSKYLYDGDIISPLRNIIEHYQSKNVYLQNLIIDDLKYLLKIHNTYIRKCNNSTSNKKKAYKYIHKEKLKTNIRKKIRNKIRTIMLRRNS